MTHDLLSIRDLAVTFHTDDGPVAAVDGFSLDVARGEAVGLVGESGCGKSVSALAAMRLLPRPHARILRGRVMLRDRDLLGLPIADLRAVRGREIAMIFQEPMTALSPLVRVGDQLIEALGFHHRLPARDARQVAREWLEKVGIPDPADRLLDYPFQLSGGMRQRAMIAMALMLEPALLIADEPTTALDVTLQAQILDLIRDAAIRRGTSVLFITHDMGVVWEMCSRVAVMYAGEVVELGPVDGVVGSPAHPYTQGLLRSLPRRAVKGQPLPSIPGAPPSGPEFPAGCRFAARCPHASARCCSEHPPLLDIGSGRFSRCFLCDPAAPAAGRVLNPSNEAPAGQQDRRPEGPP